MQTSLLFDFDDSLSFREFMKTLEENIKHSMGESVFFAWFKDISFKSYDGKTLVLSVKNEKIKNCIFLHYQIKFERILEKTFTRHFKKKLRAFELSVEEKAIEPKIVPDIVLQQEVKKEPSRFNIAIALERKHTFANFIESNQNKLSVGFAKHFANLIVQNSEDILQFSKQFFIHGGIGNGKTHLSQAIAHQVKSHGFEVMYTTAERFLFNFQTSIKKNDTVEFTKSFLGIKLLILDDIHFIATKKKTMEEVQRVAYSIISDGGFVLFCSSVLPSNLPIDNLQVKDFISSSYLIKIENPTEEFRYQILKFKTQNCNYKISDSVLRLLASKIQTNIRELEGAMGRMVLHSQILNYEIDKESSSFITTDIFPHKELKKFSVTEVQTKVCSNFGVSFEEMTSRKRVKSILKARQIAIYIASRLTTASYIELGKYFKRTHSTVIHSIKIIEKEMAVDKHFKEEINTLKISIEQQIS